ncbi:MAG: hypothetical protein KA841_00800, partial [Chitinophagales bacterium]|nr:hypothetical protein [Chitinophagales bacterium]
FCVTFLFAQSNFEDVVYLKNGSIIHGMIIEQVTNVSIKIRTGDRNIFVFKIDEIEKITKEELVKKEDEKSNADTDTFNLSKVKTKGYINTLEIGGVFGVGQFRRFYAKEERYKSDNNLKLFSFQNISSFKLNSKTAVGFGLGVEVGKVDGNKFVNLNLPFFADFRIRPIAKRFSPIFIEQIGFSMLPLYAGGTSEPLKIGALLNTKVGLNTYINSRSSFSLGLGYRFQHYSYKANVYYYYFTQGEKTTVHELYHFLSFFLSIQF